MKYRRPNVLFLLSDQHNARVLGCEGHPDIRTPHLDELASRGVRFERAYCNNAICMPSRCSLFSGRRPRELGVYTNEDSNSPALDQAVSLQSTFRQNGYRTAAFGKRHLHGGCDEGWDIAASHLIIESPRDNYVDWVAAQGFADAFDRDWAAEFGRGAEETPAHDREIPYALLSVRQSELPRDMTMEAWTKRRTVEFLEQQAGTGQPFFCFASFYRPHQPYTPLPEYFNRFDRSHWGRGRNAGDGLAMPASLRQPVETLPPGLQSQSRGSNRIWRFDLARENEQLYRDYLAAYYALVEEIDSHAGDILAALDRCGLRENTIIVYSADHGDFAGAHGMGEKCAGGHNVYEDTLRVPLIASGPGIAPRPVPVSGLVELVDLYPTLLDLAGLDPSFRTPPPSGESFAPALRREPFAGKPFIVSENRVQAAVVTPDHKLGVWKKDGEGNHLVDFPDMLFARRSDPCEVTNLCGDPEAGDVETGLREILLRWQEAVSESGARETEIARSSIVQDGSPAIYPASVPG